MGRPTDSERRKQRDASIRSLDEAIAEHLAEAQRSGELQSAESYGRPLAEAEGWAQTPLEFRLPFKILKNAGMPPAEVEMFRKRARLRAELEVAAGEAERRRLQQQLAELEQALALRLEGMRASGKL
jgi:hypothetical protein